MSLGHDKRKQRKGLGTGIPVGSDAIDAAMTEIMSAPTVSIETAAIVLRVGRNLAYREAALGGIPTVRLGACYRVPTAKLLDMLGVEPAKQVA